MRGPSRSLAVSVLAITFVIAFAIVSAGCGPSLDAVEPAAGVTTVAVRDNAFAPQVIEVPAGSVITWDWEEAGRGHNVVGDGFSSDVQSDGSYRHTFDAPGTYDYLCTLHGGMRGRVIVNP